MHNQLRCWQLFVWSYITIRNRNQCYESRYSGYVIAYNYCALRALEQVLLVTNCSFVFAADAGFSRSKCPALRFSICIRSQEHALTAALSENRMRKAGKCGKTRMERMFILFFSVRWSFSRPISLIPQSRPAVNRTQFPVLYDDDENLIICLRRSVGAGQEKKHDTDFVTSRRCRSVISYEISAPR